MSNFQDYTNIDYVDELTEEPTNDDLCGIQDGSFDSSRYKHNVVFERIQRDFIIDYMRYYFHNKSMIYGGPIRDEDLFTEENIELVSVIDLSSSLEIAFTMLNRHKDCDLDDDTEDIDDMVCLECRKKIELVIGILQHAKDSHVPQERSGGLLLLHLELCLGIDIL